MTCARFYIETGNVTVVTMCAEHSLCGYPSYYFGTSMMVDCGASHLRNILSFIALALSVYCAI